MSSWPWSIAHLVIHLRYRAHLAAHTSDENATVLLVILAFAVVVSLALFLLSLTDRDSGGLPPVGRHQ